MGTLLLWSVWGANRSTQKVLKRPKENQETRTLLLTRTVVELHPPSNDTKLWPSDQRPSTVTEFYVWVDEMLFYYSLPTAKRPIVGANNLPILLFFFSKYEVPFPFFAWDSEGPCPPSQLITKICLSVVVIIWAES